MQELGLGEHAKAFKENGIDFDSLSTLTEERLERIGLSVGARIKLRAGIAKLAASPLSSLENPRDEASRAASAAERGRAERRQVTVMFCDMVDSTSLARRLDLEDLGSVMGDYQKACGSIIKRYQGHVSQYRGDGIEAYFGWPSAHEDAAERAVRAGLEIVEAVKGVASPEPLSVRVGISTGLVVTGFDERSKPLGVVGETRHVAAHLQTIAKPNSVIIAEGTSRLVSARFEQQELEPMNLTGVAEPGSARPRRVEPIRGRTDARDDAAGRAADRDGLSPATLAGRQGR
jgi:class 3 adenylate cyclase